MTGAETITKFRNMVDDELDADYEYQLLNDAKDELEAMLAWEQLKYEQSYSVAAGYSYLTALGTLPTRFALDSKMVEDTSYIPYDKYDFEDRDARANAAFGYFFDLAGGNIYLTGQVHSSKTMYFYFTKYSADITSGTSWAFPSRFHTAIPYKMAELYYASDAGERGRSWDDKWSEQFERILTRMTLWNDQLKMKNRRPVSRPPYASPKAIR